MTREQVFNFSAGPSVLPEEVLKRAGAEILNAGFSAPEDFDIAAYTNKMVDMFAGE